MANDKHVALLKQGVHAWNAWRRENPLIRLDLSEADLKGANLSGVNLSWADLFHANLGEASLAKADLGEADLREATLSGASLVEANLRLAKLFRVLLAEADLTGAKLGGADLSTVDDTDLADWLVRNGLAFDWPQYSQGAYADAQRDAEQNERGLWAGTFVMPWQFRACLRNRGRASKCSDL